MKEKIQWVLIILALIMSGLSFYFSDANADILEQNTDELEKVNEKYSIELKEYVEKEVQTLYDYGNKHWGK